MSQEDFREFERTIEIQQLNDEQEKEDFIRKEKEKGGEEIK